MPQHGSVFLDDTHSYKKVIKEKLGGDDGVGEWLESKGQTNFDFWVHRNGIIWISDNGEGGQQVETDLNFYDLFPEFKPADDTPAQDRNYDLPSDSEEDYQVGEIYEAANGLSYYVADDDHHYQVHKDRQGNTYYIGPDGQSHWT
jgi:hypothetical protein